MQGSKFVTIFLGGLITIAIFSTIVGKGKNTAGVIDSDGERVKIWTSALSPLIPGYPGISRPVGYPFTSQDNFHIKTYPKIS